MVRVHTTYPKEKYFISLSFDVEEYHSGLGQNLFSVMEYWFQDKIFVQFVNDAWKRLDVQGWGAYVLKEKFKGIKKELKVWKKDVFGNLELRYK